MEKEKVNILMVDDQPGKLLSYDAMLGELGENLIHATSGREALELLLKHDVAVVLMDVSMPDIDGFQLAEIILAHPRFEKTAIIFISAVHLTDIDRLKGYQHGAVDYISVPVIPELLRAKVSAFAELHRKTQQLQRMNRELEERVRERTEELERRAQSLQRLNHELEQRNQQLDAIVKTVPDIIFSRQLDGSRDYISDRFYEYTGAEPGSANGSGWLRYVHPDDRERSLKRWLESVRSGQNYEAEYRMLGRDGDYRWFRARAVPIRDQNGQILRWYGSCSDIHDSKVLEQSMRDNAVRLEKMVSDRTAQLRRLSVRLMSMQDEERRRMAREIHDGLGQELAVAKILVDGLIHQHTNQSWQQAASDASHLIDKAIQEVRSLSYLLHPPLLDEAGLLSALRWYLDGLTKRSGIEFTLDVPAEFARLNPALEMAVFRIIQEALTNVFRHSGASRGCVSLSERDDRLIVTVADDGKGFDENVMQMQPDRICVGIGGMRQRAQEFGGELIVSNANPGTLVEVTIPITNGTGRLEARQARVTA